MMHPEGQYDFGSDQYHFNLTDHLGNVRVVVNEAGTVLQRQDYYPFGLSFNSSGNVSDYKYNGKEEQEETGWLDYHARQYDPALGRMLSIDPLADMMTTHNPYHYTFNNPILFNDPSGMATTYNWETQRYEDDNGKEVSVETALSENGLSNKDRKCGDCPDPESNDDFAVGTVFTFAEDGEHAGASYLLTLREKGKNGWLKISDPQLDEVVVTGTLSHKGWYLGLLSDFGENADKLDKNINATGRHGILESVGKGLISTTYFGPMNGVYGLINGNDMYGQRAADPGKVFFDVILSFSPFTKLFGETAAWIDFYLKAASTVDETSSNYDND